ncbi:MAG: TetR/AcrR family transcriptional regulator [Rivularia sp. ALOHA_DT_140]|nr:TetR/AcrR family transcriptional regulator [Rivularia sp. ALOHA_DT_140]
MQRLEPEKREAILIAAKQRLRQYGIQKTKMQEIAKDVGIAVGTLYLYFKNKNDILIASIEAYGQQHIDYAEEILNSAKSPQEKLKYYIINRFRITEDINNSGSHAAELVRALMKLKPDFVEEQSNWTRKNVLKILREGIETDLFCIDNLERDVEVFLYSIGYFFPFVTTKQYYQIEEKDLVLVIDWFIEKWLC